MTARFLSRGRQVEESTDGYVIAVDHRALVRVLFIATGGMTAAGIVYMIATYGLGFDGAMLILRLIGMEGEQTILAWFSSGLIALASLLAAANYRLSRQNGWRWHWLALSIGLLLMSIDEAVSVHEFLGAIFLPGIVFTGFFSFSWTVIALPVVAVIALLFMPFIQHQPSPTRIRLIVAGAAYLTGALGFELLGGSLSESSTSIAYLACVVCEESLEMIGMVLLVRALVLRVIATSPGRGNASMIIRIYDGVGSRPARAAASS